MDFTKIQSTNIAEAAWHDSELYLRFHSGDLYRYEEVPSRVFDELVAAPSAGKYFHSHIKAAYQFHQVRPIN